MNYRFLYFIILHISITLAVKAQLSAPGAKASFGAAYTADTTYYVDTVFANTNDTLFVLGNELYIGDSVYLFNTDSIYAEGLSIFAYRLLNEKYPLMPGKTKYWFTVMDIKYSQFVYIFNIEQDQANKKTGVLNAKLTSDTAKLVFEWYKYDTVAKNFGSLLKKDSALTASQLTDLGSGGYKVIIHGTKDTAFFAWLFINDDTMSLDGMKIDLETQKVKPNFYTCRYLDLKCVTGYSNIIYYDFSNGKQYIYRDTMLYNWTSDKEVTFSRTKDKDTYRVNSPPAEDTYFFLETSDLFENTRLDTVWYVSIQTKAEFEMYWIDAIKERNNKNYEKATKAEGSSPLKVALVDKSKNAKDYSWNYSDGYNISSDESIENTGVEYQSSHIYFVPGTYTIQLATKSKYDCVDTFKLAGEIVVKPSEIEAPNYFSPNEDGINDVFRIWDVSLSFFSIFIYDRWGNKVYEFEGDINEWDGWKGTIRNSDNPAKEGVYYYVIRAKGWEQNPSVNFDGKNYTGVIHLYR